jgi:hypothetical protein
LLASVLLAAATVVSGCGGGGGSGISEDELSEAPNVRYEGADFLYTIPEGECIVVKFLTSSDEAGEAENGSATEAVALDPKRRSRRRLFRAASTGFEA